MKSFLVDLFEFHHYYNQKLIAFLKKENMADDAQINLWFAHMINAHQIWNARVLGTKTLAVHQKRSLAENKPMDILNFDDSISILDSFKLHDIIKYKNSKGILFAQPLPIVLFHITNHHAHHRAQIIYKIRQNGVTPPTTDYIHYKRLQSINGL